MRRQLFLTLLGFGLALTSYGKASSPRPGDLKVLQNLFIFGADLSKVDDKILDQLAAQGAEGFELPGTVSEPRDCQRLGEYFKRNKDRHFTGGLNVAVDVDRD